MLEISIAQCDCNGTWDGTSSEHHHQKMLDCLPDSADINWLCQPAFPMLTPLIVMTVMLQPSGAAGAPAPPHIKTFLEQSQQLRQGTIAQLEHTLRGLKSGNIQASSRAGQIARIESDLAALRANQRFLVNTLSFPPEVGAIGRLPGLGVHVEQVLVPGEMLATCYFRVAVVDVKKFQPKLAAVKQPVLLLVEGVSTAGLEPGRDVQLAQTFEVKQRRSVVVDGLRKTALVVAPFDLRALIPYAPHLRSALANEPGRP